MKLKVSILPEISWYDDAFVCMYPIWSDMYPILGGLYNMVHGMRIIYDR